MDNLEKLIYEALLKFPSEDIRELVAKETGLTVEEVSQKMNEKALELSKSFPADNFTHLEISKIDVGDVGDLNGDGNYNTEEDKKIAEKIIKNTIDANSDGKVTFKVAVCEDTDDYTRIGNLDFETKTAKIGTTIDEIKPAGYKAYSYYHSQGDTYKYFTEATDLDYLVDNYYYINDMSRIYFTTYIADGAVIIFVKE